MGDGNGTLDKKEFDAMINNPDIQAWLTIIGLEMHEIKGLFTVLDDGDGVISYQEFVGGCMRLKGNARALTRFLSCTSSLTSKPCSKSCTTTSPSLNVDGIQRKCLEGRSLNC